MPMTLPKSTYADKFGVPEIFVESIERAEPWPTECDKCGKKTGLIRITGLCRCESCMEELKS